LGIGNRAFKIFIERSPIPQINESDQKSFIDLVDEILNMTKIEDYLMDKEKQNEVKKLEHQIDKLVYELYDFIPEEIEIIENSIKK
jgi:hypothetical protein